MKAALLGMAGLAGLVLLAACSKPNVALHPVQEQYRMASVQHWNALAERTAASLVPALQASEEIDPRGHVFSEEGVQLASLAGRRVYVNAPPSDMPFGQTYKPLLEQALMDHGLAIAREPYNATVVNLQVRSFLYRPDSGVRHSVGYASLWAAAYALGYSFDDKYPWKPINVAAGAAVIGPALDFLIAINDTTDAEVAVTTSVVDDARVIYQDTEVVYVQPQDLPFYWSRHGEGAVRETRALGEQPPAMVRVTARSD